jgi:hypothetical protein
MEWVKGVEDLDIRIFRAQGIVGVGVCSRTFTALSQPVVCLQITAAGYIRDIRSFCR